MDSHKVTGMYHHILKGYKKEQSHHVTDAESSAKWDQLEAEVAAIKQRNPKAQMTTPHETP